MECKDLVSAELPGGLELIKGLKQRTSVTFIKN